MIYFKESTFNDSILLRRDLTTYNVLEKKEKKRQNKEEKVFFKASKLEGRRTYLAQT